MGLQLGQLDLFFADSIDQVSKNHKRFGQLVCKDKYTEQQNHERNKGVRQYFVQMHPQLLLDNICG
ncbi:hypothetical protein D3C86_2099160 [compost metagenome]